MAGTETTVLPCRKFEVSVKGGNYSIVRPGEHDLIILTADAVEFRVRSEVLCAQSEYFVALLSSGMVEEQSRLVRFEDIDSSTVETFVRFCCTGEVVVCGQTFLPLLRLASRLLCKTLLDILQNYLQDEFMSIRDEDLSSILSTNFDRLITNLTRKLLLEKLIERKMLHLSFDVVVELLKEDDLVSTKEDDVLQFVRDYCKEWELDSNCQKQLLDSVRLPKLTMSAFERAAISVNGFSECKAFEPIVNVREFVDVVGEDQLRPRRGNNIHITMFWVGEIHEESSGFFSIVRPLVIPSTGSAVTMRPNRFVDVDRCYLAGCDSFSFSPYVSVANHLFSIISIGFIEKLTFKKDGIKKWDRPNSFCHSDSHEMEHVIGVDSDEDCFYLSCLGTGRNDERVFVIKCQLIQKDDLRTEKVPVPPQVASLRCRRMIFRQKVICMLDQDRNLIIYKEGFADVVRVAPADEFTPKYVEIALQGDKLYVFDYSECPVHLHDFQQPFSHFDRVRVYSLAEMRWCAQYSVNLNALRQTGYNELIDFSVNMYFIRGQLYFTWMYQARMYLFRLNEEAGHVDCVFDCKVPKDANGVILLPGFYSSHTETTILERYVQSFCQKKLQVVGENRLDARKMTRWREKYLDGVNGNGFFPNVGDGTWYRA